MKTLLFFCLFAVSTTVLTAQAGTGLSIGDVATDFSLKGIDGEMHSLASAAGEKGAIVIFTCNSCPYSIAYEDRIVELQATYGPQGYNVVAINPNDPVVKPADSFEAMAVRAGEKSFNFPYLFDDGQEVYPVWGATKTPHVFLLDASNTVRYIGAIDNNTDASKADEMYLANAIAALEAGKDPEPAMTKAIGCGIKKQKS
ncbi:MAG: thioredoxin family protein [Saprospiraceae bacterium]